MAQPMDEEFTISTPEQVAFHYETAGIGSRVVASLLDHLLIGLALAVIYIASAATLIAALTSSLSGDNGDASQATFYVVAAILVLVTFLIIFGYFTVFEIAWKGQTPGKRVGRLRVIKRTGQPSGTSEAVVRNLVRLVDFLPIFYGVGLISMFVDRDARRLGDLAAGTIVVREGEQVRLRDVQVAPSPANPAQAAPLGSATGVAGYETATPAAPTPRYDPLPGVSLRGLTPQDYLIMSQLLQRVRRGEMQWNNGRELSARVAYGVAGKLRLQFPGMAGARLGPTRLYRKRAHSPGGTRRITLIPGYHICGSAAAA